MNESNKRTLYLQMMLIRWTFSNSTVNWSHWVQKAVSFGWYDDCGKRIQFNMYYYTTVLVDDVVHVRKEKERCRGSRLREKYHDDSVLSRPLPYRVAWMTCQNLPNKISLLCCWIKMVWGDFPDSPFIVLCDLVSHFLFSDRKKWS